MIRRAFDRPRCKLPPKGWRCTRGAGHNGPCAAVECDRRPIVLAVFAVLACLALWFLWWTPPVLTWQQDGGRDYFNILTTDATGERLDQVDAVTVCTPQPDGTETCRYQATHRTHGAVTMKLQTCYYPSKSRPVEAECSPWVTATRKPTPRGFTL